MKKLIQSALEGLGDVDKSKRKFIKQAGALGAIAATPKAVRKMVGDNFNPAIKTAVNKVPSNIFESVSFTNAVKADAVKKALAGEYGEETKIFAQNFPDEIFEVVDSPSTVPAVKQAYEYFRHGGKRKPNELAKSLMEEHPDSSPQEFANALGESGEAGSSSYTQTLLFTDKETYGDIGGQLFKNAQEGNFDWDLIPNMEKPDGFDSLSEGQKKYIYEMAVVPSNYKRLDGNESWINDNVRNFLEFGKTIPGKIVK